MSEVWLCVPRKKEPNSFMSLHNAVFNIQIKRTTVNLAAGGHPAGGNSYSGVTAAGCPGSLAG